MSPKCFRRKQTRADNGGIDMAGGELGVLAVLAGILLAVLWIALPFAVFGIKARMDRTNALLEDLLAELRNRS